MSLHADVLTIIAAVQQARTLCAQNPCCLTLAATDAGWQWRMPNVPDTWQQSRVKGQTCSKHVMQSKACPNGLTAPDAGQREDSGTVPESS